MLPTSNMPPKKIAGAAFTPVFIVLLGTSIDSVHASLESANERVAAAKVEGNGTPKIEVQSLVGGSITVNPIKEKKSAKLNLLKPLFYLIILNSIIPFLIWKKVSKKVDEIEFIDTFRFTFSKVTFPLFYMLQTWIISLFFDWNVAEIYFLTSVLLILIYSKLSITNTEA